MIAFGVLTFTDGPTTFGKARPRFLQSVVGGCKRSSEASAKGTIWSPKSALAVKPCLEPIKHCLFKDGDGNRLLNNFVSQRSALFP